MYRSRTGDNFCRTKAYKLLSLLSTERERSALNSVSRILVNIGKAKRRIGNKFFRFKVLITCKTSEDPNMSHYSL